MADGDVVTCVLGVDPLYACVTTSTATSNAIEITIGAAVVPAVSIATPDQSVCSGTAVTFTATAVNAGVSPAYQWKVNNVNVGSNSSQYTSNILADNDVVSCMLTADPAQACVSNTAVTSNTINMTVETALVPTLSITASAQAICTGTPVTFNAAAQQAGAAPAYQWKLNGADVGSNSPSYINTTLTDNDEVYCVLSTGSSICATAAVNSNTVAIKVGTPPVLSISPADTTVVTGTQLQLNPSVTGSPAASFTWTPATDLSDPFSFSPYTRPLTATQSYTLRIVTAEGCTASKTVTIKAASRKLSMPNAFSPNGDGRNDVFRIPPGVLFNLKEFIIYDRWGYIVFTTSFVNQGWDGSVNGVLKNAGTYVYVIRGAGEDAGILLKGVVTLIR